MAADNTQQDTTQFTKIYTLAVPPGIKRDGTYFETDEYTDGVWCRFQRGIPKKMGGYRSIFSNLVGIYRGLFAQPYNGVNYIFGGNYKELDIATTGLTFATGVGPFAANILPGTAFVAISPANSTANTVTISGSNVVSTFPANSKVTFSQLSNATTFTVVSASYSSNTVVTLSGGTVPNTANTVYLTSNAVFTPDPAAGPYANLWQFDSQFSPLANGLYVFAHPGKNLNNIDNGVPSQVLVGAITPGANYTWNFSGLSDSLGQNPTYKPISVDGGVCILYPFIFVYGSNGFIANNNVSGNYTSQNFYDWNGPLANQVNLSSSKIVKGVPMRGGTNSPSGLFWATDSLIRVTFNPAGSGSGTIPSTYWNYDIVSSQISIMSSSAVVEMDGVYWWMGIDRFYAYNGQVQVVPNDKNVNYLFDNINYDQRQKVWATKVPRYNEIWFFYPRGTATECTDAIIYNTKDKIWYDAGQAIGSQRSCGYTTELFPNPIWADWNYDPIYGQARDIIAHPASLAAPAANQIYLAGDQTALFSPGDFLTFSNIGDPTPYLITGCTNIYNTTVTPPGVTLITCSSNFSGNSATVGQPVYYATGGYNLWQHEYGQNQIGLLGETAVYSSITTSDISWISGTPGGNSLVGINRRMHIRRIEPNFLQSGLMSMTILGRKFASGSMQLDEQDSGPYFFDPDTGKIDLRVEHRLIQLKFESNTLGGNYEMGKLVITAEYGDERP